MRIIIKIVIVIIIIINKNEKFKYIVYESLDGGSKKGNKNLKPRS